MLIDYNRLAQDREYFSQVINDIQEKITDVNEISKLESVLANKQANSEIDPINASILTGVLRTQREAIIETRKQTKSARQKEGRQLTMSPTSASGHRGMVSMVLIVSSVAMTAVLYALLWIAHITK